MSRSHKRFFIFFISLLFFLASCFFCKNSLSATPASLHLEPILISVKVNEHTIVGIFRCYIDDNHKIWIDTNELHAWGLNTLPQQPMEYLGNQYYQLDWYQGLKYVFDSYALQLLITVPPHWLPATQISGQPLPFNSAIRPKEPGLFLNYDITGQHNSVINQSYTAGTTELGYFNHWGIGTSTFLFNNQPKNTNSHGLTRLETTWTLDEPEKIATWRFGDAITSSVDWSGATRFGGIQYATNFSTQPNLVTFPLPAFHGEAAIPSTVDIFVNSALRQQQQINSGPFYVNDIPVVIGAGSMRVVTQDLLGRQQVSILPYYASEQLLKPGLVDFSYEAGVVRLNYGIQGNEYGRALIAGSYRRGLTSQDTFGGHLELLANQQTIGFGNDYLIDNYGVLTMAGAASHSFLGNGGLIELAFRRQTPTLSFGERAIATTTHYQQLGLLSHELSPSLTAQAFISYSSTRFGSFSASYTELKNRKNLISADENFALFTPNSHLLTLNYSQTLMKHLYCLFGTASDFEHHNNNQIFASLVWSIGKSTSASLNTLHQIQHNQSNVELNKNLPLGNGYGYRLLAGTNSGYEGDFAWNNDYSTLSAKYANVNQTSNYQLNATGSVIHFGGTTLLARATDNSFALVQVPEFKNVKVYYRNQLIGKTNKQGNLYIPRLLPYQENDIRIDPKDLPLNTIIESVNKQSIPYFRSGVLVKFPVRLIQNATITLFQTNHQLVPAGAYVVLSTSSSSEQYPVGYDGKVFLYSVNSGTIKAAAIWDQHICRFTVKIPMVKNAIVDLGKITCH